METILPVTITASGIPAPPPHWIHDGERDSPNYTGSLLQKLGLAAHRTLCLITFGETSLRPLWEWSRGDTVTKDWKEARSSLRERIQHTNIVGGLLLTTIAALCSTDPPANSKFLPYTKEGPACLLLLAFGLSFAGLVVGSVIVLVVGESNPTWSCEVLLGTRARIWLTMILLGYPFLAIAGSALSFAAGLLVAVTYSKVNLIKYGGYVLVASSVACTAAFIWILSIKKNAGKDDFVDEEKV